MSRSATGRRSPGRPARWCAAAGPVRRCARPARGCACGAWRWNPSGPRRTAPPPPGSPSAEAPRTSSAIFSSDAAAMASVAQNSAWRSRWMIWRRNRRRVQPEVAAHLLLDLRIDVGEVPDRAGDLPHRDRLAGPAQALEVAAGFRVPDRDLEAEGRSARRARRGCARPSACPGGAAASAPSTVAQALLARRSAGRRHRAAGERWRCPTRRRRSGPGARSESPRRAALPGW